MSNELARAVFQRTLVDAAGNLLEGGTIAVYQEPFELGVTPLAEIYAERDGTTNLQESGPIEINTLTNPKAFFRFYGEVGEYAIRLQKDGSEVVWRNVNVVTGYPQHFWEDTKLQFVQFDGTLGDQVDLAPTFSVTKTDVNPDQSPDVSSTTTPGAPPNVELAFELPKAADVSLGTVTVVNPDQQPTITDVGTDGDVELDFDIPRASAVSVGTTTPVNPDQNPAVNDSGTDGDVVLDFDLPLAPSFEVGTVTIVDTDDPAVITDVGVDGNIKLDFEIPRGPTGSLGAITGFSNSDLSDPADLFAAVQSETTSITERVSVQAIAEETIEQLVAQENTFAEDQVFEKDVTVDGGLQVGGNTEADSYTLQGNPLTQVLSTTVLTTDWSGTGPFIATMQVTGLLSSDVPVVDLDLSSVNFSDVPAVLSEFAAVYRVEASDDDELKVYALAQPTEDISLSIQVVR